MCCIKSYSSVAKIKIPTLVYAPWVSKRAVWLVERCCPCPPKTDLNSARIVIYLWQCKTGLSGVGSHLSISLNLRMYLFLFNIDFKCFLVPAVHLQLRAALISWTPVKQFRLLRADTTFFFLTHFNSVWVLFWRSLVRFSKMLLNFPLIPAKCNNE